MNDIFLNLKKILIKSVMPLDVIILQQLELYFQLVPNQLQYLYVKIVLQNLGIITMFKNVSKYF